MAIKYYPLSKIIPNLSTSGGNFLNSEGKPYTGKYYVTFDGKFFAGAYPNSGTNEELTKTDSIVEPTAQENGPVTLEYNEITGRTEDRQYVSNSGAPISYFPNPTPAEYKKGYVIRYFIKKVNQVGLVTEISPTEYNDFINGVVNYDVSMYQTVSILWKLTGPLNSQRKSQYNIIPGIIDTNKRLTETAAKTFVGIVEFIGGEYSKFARPTP